MKSFDDKRILVLMHQGYSMLEAQAKIQEEQANIVDNSTDDDIDETSIDAEDVLYYD